MTKTGGSSTNAAATSQILMHYAALRGFEWDRYIQAMRDGLEVHGPVRTGLYRTTDGKGAV